MSKPTSVTRAQIENLIRRIFETENARPITRAEETIAGIDLLMASGVEGWSNGKHCPDRAEERKFEQALFEALEDYHREVERALIDPPFATLQWRLTSMKRDLQMSGCSIWEVDEAGLMARYWIYFDPIAFAAAGLSTPS